MAELKAVEWLGTLLAEKGPRELSTYCDGLEGPGHS